MVLVEINGKTLHMRKFSGFQIGALIFIDSSGKFVIVPI